LGSKVKPGRSVGIQTLAQRWTRRNAAKPKSALEEGVRAKVLDGVKACPELRRRVVLAQTQQAQVALEDVAVSNARAYGKGRIDQRVELNSFEIFPNECQSGVRTEVVGQLFDNEVGHDVAHLQGEQHFTPKSLIYKDKSTFI
jgi:hypothetical protein